jgi:hypothetical protein
LPRRRLSKRVRGRECALILKDKRVQKKSSINFKKYDKIREKMIKRISCQPIPRREWLEGEEQFVHPF